MGAPRERLRLGASMRPVSVHAAAWRYPGAFPDANFNLRHPVRFARRPRPPGPRLASVGHSRPTRGEAPAAGTTPSPACRPGAPKSVSRRPESDRDWERLGAS